MKQRKLAVALALIGSASAMAQTTVLPDVAVTAKAIVDDSGVDSQSATSATVREAQLRDQNAVDLASALRRTPGVQISRYNPVGGHGGDQGGAVFIRGMGGSRPGSEIKTYIDGTPVYMGVWGHSLLDMLPINVMESITVYKSAQPHINGNNFASINLQTKSVTEEGIHGAVRATAGSFNTVTEQAELTGRAGAMDFVLAQGHAKSDGHRPNADGELNNLFGKVNFRVDQNWSFGMSLLHVNNQTGDPGEKGDAPPAKPVIYKTRADMTSAYLTHKHGDWQGELRVYRNQGDGNLFNDATWGTFYSRFEMSGIRWREEFSPWKGGKFIAGIDHDRWEGSVKGNNTGGREALPSFKLTSPHFAVSQAIDLNREWSVVPAAGVRFYDHSQYVSKSSPHAGVSLVSAQLTVFANVSRGINYPGQEAPALQAAMPAMFAGKTWNTLRPEEVDHKEIGLKWIATPSTQVDVSLFQDEVKNRYVYDLAFGSTTFYNTGAYKVTGAELQVRHQISNDWSSFAGITLLDPTLKTLPYAPAQALTAGVNGKVGAFKVSLDVQAQSDVWALNRSRDTLSPNTSKVGGFAVTNARVSYPMPSLGKKGEVFVAVENLFDKQYAYRPGYPMPGRWGQLGIAASF